MFRWTLRRVIAFFEAGGDPDFTIEPLTVGLAGATAILWPIGWVTVVVTFPHPRRSTGQSEVLARLQEWVTQ